MKEWNLSFKKIDATIILDIGPIPPTIAKLEELIIFMEALTKKEGITVAKTAINNPKPYTCQGKLNRSVLPTMLKCMNRTHKSKKSTSHKQSILQRQILE